MPRPPRLHVPGACYHVVLRGNHRESLFDTVADRAVLNEIVADALPRFGCRIHAFCWMTNHLHLLVQIAERPLGKLVQRVAVRYSRYRHKALLTRGHLFERRYKAKLVDVDAYFLVLLRYIHMNPVKSAIVTDPSHYPWSSHRAFLGIESVPWLTTEFGLSLFSKDVAQARIAYRGFIIAGSEHGKDLDPQSHPDDPRVLGTDTFIANIPVVPHRQRCPLTLEQFAVLVCGERRVSPELLRSPSRERHLASIRAVFAVQAIERHIGTQSEIARFLNRDASSLRKLLERHALTRGKT